MATVGVISNNMKDICRAGRRIVARSGNCQMNIAHYRKLLETSLDKPTRATVERLLANEHAHFAECCGR
jgi:hypothetical protein